MTLPIDASSLPALRPPQPHEIAAKTRRKNAEVAAEKFEGLMLTNLLKSAFGESGESMFGNGPGSHIYRGFMETYLAEHLASAGGLGLQATLVHALGGGDDPPVAPAANALPGAPTEGDA